MASEILNVLGQFKRGGITPADVKAALGDLTAIRGLLERQYGAPGPAWNPDDPLTVLEATLNDAASIDVQGALQGNRPAAHVVIRNLGADAFQVILNTEAGASKPLTVMPSPAVPQDLQLNVISVRVLPAAGKTAAYQILAQ